MDLGFASHFTDFSKKDAERGAAVPFGSALCGGATPGVAVCSAITEKILDRGGEVCYNTRIGARDPPALLCDICICWCGAMAAQLICNQSVVGSTPITSSKDSVRYGAVFSFSISMRKCAACSPAGGAFFMIRVALTSARCPVIRATPCRGAPPPGRRVSVFHQSPRRPARESPRSSYRPENRPS